MVMIVDMQVCIEDALLAVNLRHEGTEAGGGDIDDCLCVSVYTLDIKYSK
jgi:hypothetical protein